MNKIYKTKSDDNSLSLEGQLKSYTREKIQKPLNALLTMNKGSLAVLTPLAAASLISADINAQCGVGNFDPTGGVYSEGQIDVDGDGNPDFDFEIGGNFLSMIAVGTMSFEINSFNVNALPYGATIDGLGTYTNFTFFPIPFVTTLNSGTPSTAYAPVKSASGHLGFIEINFDGTGGFDIDIMQTGLATVTGSVIAGDCPSLVGALPITLINFEATTRNKEVLLSWATASELNNEGFEIQRSVDGENFYKIGWINGAGTIETNMDYSFSDKELKSNVLYYYRLKQMDFNGEFSYSPVANAKINGDQMIEVGTIYPNPLSYELLNAFGQKIAAQVQTISEGLNTISIPTSGLSNGTYFLKINALELSEYKKIIIQK